MELQVWQTSSLQQVNMLRQRNEKYRAIKFVDICADDYSAEDNNNIDFEEVITCWYNPPLIPLIVITLWGLNQHVSS